MPIPDDYFQFLEKLEAKTDAGGARWQFDDSTVELSVGDNRIGIWGGWDEMSERSFISFALKDGSGRSLDSWVLDQGDRDYDFLNRIYNSAKRHSLGVPKRIEALLQAIDNSEKFGDLKPPRPKV